MLPRQSIMALPLRTFFAFALLATSTSMVEPLCLFSTLLLITLRTLLPDFCSSAGDFHRMLATGNNQLRCAVDDLDLAD